MRSMRLRSELRGQREGIICQPPGQGAGWAGVHYFRSDGFKAFGESLIQGDTWPDGKTTTNESEAESLLVRLANPHAEAALNALLRLIKGTGVLIDVGVQRAFFAFERALLGLV